MKSLLCTIGIHDWMYLSASYDADRVCKRCSKRQMASYDMAVGETVFVNGDD